MIFRARAILLIMLCLLLWQGLGPAFGQATQLAPGEQCFSANTSTSGGGAGTGTGMIGVLGTITGGTGGAAGSYANVALTGGTGSGATANITVAGGAVTAVAVLNPGLGYAVADVLSAAAGTIGGTTGFSVPINSVSINSNLAGGSVDYYIPSTNTRKQTWQNAAQTILNANPVPLDANGCAIVYGTGSYRQVLKDSLGNIIWDQLTTAPGAAANVFWAGTAGGTPNAITVVDPGFAAVDGSIINFLALANNTGATTLNPSNYFGGSPPAIVKDTTAGPVALVGGEINGTSGGTPTVISVIWSASQNNFHLLNTVIASASGAAAPLCGAVGLKITNSVGTPSSIITLTVAQVVTQTPSGLVINRSNIILNINLTTGTVTAAANGMDGEAVGTSRWLDVWVIDNGAAAAGLASVHAGNGLSPNMPSGYTYKCRLGAMAVDGSGNLFRTLQYGPIGQYQVVLASNTLTPCHIADSSGGAVGTYSSTSPVLANASVAGDGFCAPATTTDINVIATGTWKAGGGTPSVLVAPSTAYGGTNNGPTGSNGQIYPIWIVEPATTTINQTAWMTLEASTIAWASSGSGGAIYVLNWRDSVNAN